MASIPLFSYESSMAKVKTHLDTDSGQEATAASVPVSDEEKDTQERKEKGKKEGEDKSMPEAAAEIPAHVLALLQKFPDYETLYIDAKGGIYTSGTADVIRKEAVLYRNPYYKS